VIRSGSCSSRVIPLRPWRLKNCAMMTALCGIVLDPRAWSFLSGHYEAGQIITGNRVESRSRKNSRKRSSTTSYFR